MYTITRSPNANAIFTKKTELGLNATYKYFKASEKNVLSANSYSKLKVFDISNSKVLDFYKKQVLLSAMKAFPEYQIFIKSKSTTIQQNKEELFNIIQFKLQVDEKNQLVWVTPMLSFDDKLRVKNDIAKLEKEVQAANVTEDEDYDEEDATDSD